MDKEDLKNWIMKIYLYTHTHTHTQTHTMEYYIAIRRNEILAFVTTWMDLESIMLSNISQTGKGKYQMISFICRILKKTKNT